MKGAAMNTGLAKAALALALLALGACESHDLSQYPDELS